MIGKLRLLHYLSEETYRRVCERFSLRFELANSDENRIPFRDQPITEIKPFNLRYQTFGHVWFLYVELDFPALGCSYDDFPARLYDEYRRFFGDGIMADFPAYDRINCGYIEYADRAAVPDAPAAMDALRRRGCPPEQLDRALWGAYRKPHGTVECCFAQAGAHAVELLARCHGTALKKRVKDERYHITTGILPAAAVNARTEQEILGWLRERYGIPAP